MMVAVMITFVVWLPVVLYIVYIFLNSRHLSSDVCTVMVLSFVIVLVSFSISSKVGFVVLIGMNSVLFLFECIVLMEIRKGLKNS